MVSNPLLILPTVFLIFKLPILLNPLFLASLIYASLTSSSVANSKSLGELPIKLKWLSLNSP